MKKQWFKQLLSLVLVLALLVQVIPAQVWATVIDTIETSEIITAPSQMVLENAPVTIIGEETSLRTETEKHFRLSDGSNIAVSYGMPVHYQNADGEWVDIDNTLTLSADQSAYTTTNAYSTTTFSTDLTTGRVLTSSYNGVSVAMSLLSQRQTQNMVANSVASLQTQNTLTYDNAVEATIVSDVNTFANTATNTVNGDRAWTTEDLLPEKLQSSVLYEDVYPGVDLLYTAYGYNIKEQIIVNEKQSQYRYEFMLQVDGLTAVLNADNSISMADDDGNIIYSIPAPYMVDAVGATSDAVTYTLTQVTGGYVLTVEADSEWIDAEARVFPVAIDPTLENEVKTSADGLVATYVTQGDPDKSHPNYQQLYFGYGAASSVKERRIFMHLSELPSIPDGSVVTDAQISLYLQDYSYVTCQSIGAAIYEVTEDKPENRTYQSWINYMTWNTQAAYDTTNMIDYVVLQEGNGGLKDWNITELVKKWYAEGTENRTMAMAITPGARAYSSTYCAVPVFLGYASQSYPVIAVTYQNNVGIEDYYTYATLGGGEAGSAYLADATGQLTAVKGLVSYASSINPFSLSLVYNSNYFAKNAAKVYYPTEELGLSMRLGIGWSLDVIQKVEPVIIDEVQYIKYTDGDGTVHYFSENTDEETESESEAESETETTEIVYYDEDGLGLQIVVNTDGTYTMSDIQDNIYTFTNGFLTNIKDNNNNQYLINYSNGKLTSIVQQNNNCTAITVATFAYSGDYLATVTDAAGIVHTIGYNNNHISSISNGSTTIATYNYSDNRLISMTEATSGYTLRYTYTTDGKIGHYEECTISNETGAQVDVYYNGLDKTTYRDYGNDRIKNTEDDILTYYLFDYAGRTVNAYSTDAVGNVLGASNAVYTGTGSTDKRNNRTLRTASIGVSAEQELLNSGFENSNSSYQWTLAGTITRSTDNPRTGAYSLKGVMTNNSNSVTATKASQKLYAGQTYTLSAYVNTVNVEFDYLDGITLTVSDGTNSWESYNMYHKTTETVDDGWTLISVTFTAKITGVHTVGVTASDGTGTFYVDDFQLEKGEGPSNYNLIENGNFQAEGFSWTLGSTGEYKSSNGMHRDNGEAIAPVITSTPLNGNAKISQTVTVNLPGTETYVLSGWGSANAVPDNVDTAADWAQDTTKTFGLRAILTYSDGTTEYHYAPFNADVTDWQFTSLTIIPNEPTKTVATITVVCAYEKNGNSASFDNISLVRQVAQSMTYDDNGNMTSVRNGRTTAEYSYDENGNIEEASDGTGDTILPTYDPTFTHRMLSYTDGQTTDTMSYDDVGNVTSNTVSANTDTSLEYISESSYTNNGNLLSSNTDVNGISTYYTYSSNMNKMLELPSTVRTGNGGTTNILYDNFGRTTSMSLANMALLEYYYYSDGTLQEIIRTNSYGDSQTYYMTYDDFGNVIELRIGDYILASYLYESGNGPLMEQTYGNGAYVSFIYDNLGRIKEVCQYDNGWTEYFYNGEGQLYRVEDPSGTYFYTYDTTGRLIACEKRVGWYMMMRVDLQYDANGQLVGQKWNIEGTEYSESYTYDSENGSLTTLTTATGETLQMNYDALQRISSISSNLYTKNYTYKSRTEGTTNLVTRIQYTGLPSTLAFRYNYDTEGNIATYIAPGKTIVRYIYDDAGQLVRTTGGQTNVYSYDEFGNLTSANEHTYTYGNEGWRDLLTAFDGEEITYDESGNPLSYFNGTRWTFTWQDGRRLASAVNDSTEIYYTYDGEGLRTSKSVDDSYHEYIYYGGQLMREWYDGDILDFFYDTNGHPYALNYNDTTYYYITNLQGDVIYLVDEDGETVASYEYDPYGNILSATGEMAEINPLRYRGYYYDAELEMYYLQSRYYDPMVGRFINADDVSYLGLTGTSLSYNLLAYCENDPVNTYDPFGCFVIRRWMVASVIDIILMLIPGIGAAFAPIKSMAKAYGKAALKANIKTPLVSFIKFIGRSAKAVLSGVKKIVAKIPAIGKRLAQKIPVNKLVNALAGLTASVTFNKVLNSLIENVDIVLSVGGAISGILDVAFDKKLNNSIWEI